MEHTTDTLTQPITTHKPCPRCNGEGIRTWPTHDRVDICGVCNGEGWTK